MLTMAYKLYWRKNKEIKDSQLNFVRFSFYLCSFFISFNKRKNKREIRNDSIISMFRTFFMKSGHSVVQRWEIHSVPHSSQPFGGGHWMRSDHATRANYRKCKRYPVPIWSATHSRLTVSLLLRPCSVCRIASSFAVATYWNMHDRSCWICRRAGEMLSYFALCLS